MERLALSQNYVGKGTMATRRDFAFGSVPGQAGKVRWEKVRAIKALIASGKYETDEKLGIAVEHLHRKLCQSDSGPPCKDGL